MNQSSGRTLRILHVSDLHAGPEENASGWAMLREAWDDRLASIQSDPRKVDIVCFTGDVANRPRRSDYDAASKILKRLLNRLELPVDRLFVVPGNHDVDREEAAREWSQLRKQLKEMPPATRAKWDPQKDALGRNVLRRRKAYQDWLWSMGRQELVKASAKYGLGYRIQLPPISSVPGPIHILGLDSAWLCGSDDDQQNILLTDWQVDQLTRDDRGELLRGWKLALVHHPPAWCCDSADTMDKLAPSVDLLLHGHTHEGIYETRWAGKRPMQILGASCVYEKDLGRHYPNGYHVIDVVFGEDDSLHHYDVTFYRWSGGARGSWQLDEAFAKDGRLEIHGASGRVPSPADSHPKIIEKSNIVRTMGSLASRYGKVGLLVDDSKDAEGHVARELYGTEVLPPWWCVVQGLCCAEEALQEMWNLLSRQPEMHGIVILDRYLPFEHGRIRNRDMPGDRRPVRMDMGGAELEELEDPHQRSTLDHLIRLIEALRSHPDNGQRLLVELVTSYDQRRGTGDERVDRTWWKARRTEPLRAMRVLAAPTLGTPSEPPKSTERECLFRFGPSVSSKGDRKSWSACIWDLATKISNDRRHNWDSKVILLTGWSVSEALGLHGRGLPPLKLMVEDWRAEDGIAETITEKRLESIGRCACERDAATDSPSPRPSIFEELEKLKSGSDETHSLRCARFKRRDVGHAYHHWLLARIAWDAILTINLDEYHERGALTAHDTRGVGEPVPPSDDAGPQRARLHRLLGSPLSPGATTKSVGLALAELPARLKRALPSTGHAGDRHALVALGVSQQELEHLFNSWGSNLADHGGSFPTFEIYWVDPLAHSSVLQRQVIPLCGRPIDFAHDLYAAYSTRRR